MLASISEKLTGALDAAVAKNRELFGTYVGPKALELLNDDALVTTVAAQLYPLLPMPVRFLVKEEAFGSFLLSHRRHLVTILDPAAADQAGVAPESDGSSA